MEGRGVIVIGIVTLLLCMFIVYWREGDHTPYNRFMIGTWNAPPEYCKDAQISSMLLVIGEPTADDPNKFPSYLLINNNVCNQFIDINRKKVLKHSNGTYEILCDVKFEEDEVFCGQDIHLKFSLLSGQLQIFNADELFGLLYRDNLNSIDYKD